MGPVFPDFYHKPNLEGNAGVLNPEQNGFCDLIAQLLGALSGRSLAARSHWRYPEWFEAKKRRNDKDITVSEIKRHLASVRK